VRSTATGAELDAASGGSRSGHDRVGKAREEIVGRGPQRAWMTSLHGRPSLEDIYRTAVAGMSRGFAVDETIEASA
jgi:hypothetical protein